MIGRFFSRLVYAQAGWAQATRRLQRALDPRAVPADHADQGLPARQVARPQPPRRADRRPDRRLHAGRRFSTSSTCAAQPMSRSASASWPWPRAAVAGLADYSDTDDEPRMVATVHATLMVIALVAVPGLVRAAPVEPDRRPARRRSSFR